MRYKSYQKDFEHSYSFGVFPTIELIEHQSQTVQQVLLHSKGMQNGGIRKIVQLCEEHGIAIETDDALVSRLSKKDNCYAIGVFLKRYADLSPLENHIVFVNPSDRGNLGTIIRTCVGFGIFNLGIIRPGADAFDPKVIRGSMGSVFQMKIQYFDGFDQYLSSVDHDLFVFRLNGQTHLSDVKIGRDKAYTLVFGAESSGLSDAFNDIGTGVVIPHNQHIDSLNLSVAVGIAAYHFGKQAKTGSQI